MTWLELAGAAVAGASAVIFRNWRVARKIQAIDYAAQAVEFWEKQNDKLIQRVERLESDVEKLLNFKCEKIDCPNREPPRG